MASPGGRKFDDDRPREGLDFRGKVPVKYINGFVGIWLCRGQMRSALPADTPLSLSVSGDTVFCSTLRTTDDNTVVHIDSLGVHNGKPWLTVFTCFMPHNIRHIFSISTHKRVFVTNTLIIHYDKSYIVVLLTAGV
jgi:hypothetical protein